MDQKLYSITKNKDDIIFLCDLRLNSPNQVAGMNDLNKKLCFYGYTLYHHSQKSSRGVGVLISKKVDYLIHGTRTDAGDNFILLDLSIRGVRFTLGSVYGPNEDDLPFFDSLKDGIKSFPNDNIIIGGDWNATWDNNAIDLNIDVVNMANIPSKKKSDKLRLVCNELKLIDPYRMFYPTRREYTYIPSAIGMLNRSRLDFFLISEGIINNTVSCTIPHSLASTVFDHKPIYLSTKSKRMQHKQQINDFILDCPDLLYYVKNTVFESYIHHAVVDNNFSQDHKTDLLNEIGRTAGLLQRLRILIDDNISPDVNNLGEMEIEGVRAEIREAFEDLPDLNFFENLNLGCVRSTFFEVLASNVKNVTLGHQSWIFKMKNKIKTNLTTTIKGLKANFNTNTHEILALERRLSAIVESELRTELCKIKNFDRLNNEKITPYFLKIARSSKQDTCLEDLKNDDRAFFDSDETRSEYVTGYYENIYKKPKTLPLPEANDEIAKFLGEITENQTVTNAKLTENEKMDLESPLTLQELEKSMSESNFSSAPGLDGISNRFIKHYWTFFQKPLLDYANHCFLTGELTDSFRGAKIRLIPKKGDCSKIKNWRPISLLNCFYKILSRVLTNRLRKYIDKLTPIGQKGYSENRQCQEVLISVSDCISNCNTKKIRGALLSLDISKAFDTLSHTFLNSVLVFFNFGENFRKWIRILATNRTACIILNDSKLSRNFKLERGNAQGDTISPFLFILCYQILLFKLEYDLQIIGLIEEPPLPDHLQPIPAQVPRNTCRVYAYADDGNILVRMDLSSLSRIKEILTNFGNISGLICNVEKTCLMQIGSQQPIEREIIELGFNIVDHMTILGMKIGGEQDQNFRDICGKVNKQVLFWSRFNLSLPGRICIAKSMMYSQINYLGCFLPLSIIEIQRLSIMIEDFVKGNLNISRKRLLQTTEEGGLGLFNLRDFLDAQRCSWVKRAQNLDDNWKRCLYAGCYGNILNLRASNIDQRCAPILHEIALSYERFFACHTKWNENFKQALVFDNPALTTNLRTDEYANMEFFGGLMDNNAAAIYKLTLSDIFNGGYVNIDDFIMNTGIPINQRKLTGLRGVYDTAAIKLSKAPVEQMDNTTIFTFVNRFKRGSKCFRRVFRGKKSELIPNNIVRFAANTETIIGLDLSEKLNASWNFGYLDNTLRTFIFRMHNNQLGYNHVIAHFADNIEPYCTFCLLTRNHAPARDTALHVFYSCPIVEPLNESFFSWVLGEPNIPRRSEVFGYFKMPNIENNTILFIVTKILQKYIWDCKLRKTLPNQADVRLIVMDEFKILKKVSQKFNMMLELCTLDSIK